MGKKTWISIGVSTVILTIVACVMWLNVTRHYEDNNPFDRIPTTVLAVFKINGIDNLNADFNTSNYYNDLNEILHNDMLRAAYHDIDSLLGYANITAPIVSQRDRYVAIFDLMSDTENAAFAIKLNNYLEGLTIKRKLKSIEDFSPSDTTILNNDVTTLTINGRSYFLSIIDGTLFFTNSNLLTAEIVSNDTEKMSDDVSFTTIERTASENAIVSLYVNTQLLNLLLVENVDFTKMAKWVELDLCFDKKTMSASGFASASYNSHLISMAANKPKTFGIDKYIPSDAKMFLSYVSGYRGLSNEAFVCQLAQNQRQADYRARQEKNFEKYNIDIEDLLAQVFSGDIAVYSTSTTLADTVNTCLITLSDNGTITQATLNSLIGTLHNTETPQQVGEIKPTPDLTIPVYKAFNDDDDLFFMTELFSYVPHKYYMRYENTIFMADNIEMLKHTLYENQLSRTLGYNADFKNFRSTYSDENICFLFLNSDVLLRYVKEKTQTSNELKRQQATNNFYGLGIQISALGGLKLPYLSLSLHHEPDRLQMPPTAWQSRVDTTLIGRPWGVINHNTGETEYLVQDAKNYIHLINPQGLVLWSLKLESPIVGNVTQIDYYNNNKLQMLFATAEHIHLIDRNGHNTANFPIRLQSESAGGVTYIDYNNPADFRLFIAGKDKFVHLYNKECKLIQGWEMGRTEGIANAPIRHFVSGNKDYLVMSDEYRYYITDRRGNERVALPLLAPNRNREVALVRKNTPYAAFVMATVDGLFATTNIATGKTTTKQIEQMSIEQPYYMIYNSQRNQFAVITPKKLLILNEDGNKVGDYNISLSSVDAAELLSDGTLALWDKDENLGYRYSFDGKLMTGYPLPAASPFVMAPQYGINNIVVINKDGSLYSFLRK